MVTRDVLRVLLARLGGGEAAGRGRRRQDGRRRLRGGQPFEQLLGDLEDEHVQRVLEDERPETLVEAGDALVRQDAPEAVGGALVARDDRHDPET